MFVSAMATADEGCHLLVVDADVARTLGHEVPGDRNEELDTEDAAVHMAMRPILRRQRFPRWLSILIMVVAVAAIARYAILAAPAASGRRSGLSTVDRGSPHTLLTEEKLTLQSSSRQMPDEWVQRWKSGQLVFASDVSSVPPQLMPNLGNGYLGTQFGKQWMFISGVFNGALHQSHRAHVPVTFNVRVARKAAGLALDFERGVVEEVFWWAHATVIQRTYLHQAQPHVAVTELELDNRQGDKPLTVYLNDSFVSHYQDFDMASRHDSGNRTCLELVTRKSETSKIPVVGVSLCRTKPAESYTVEAGKLERVVFASSIWTTRDELPDGTLSPLDAAQAEHQELSHTQPEQIYSSHRLAMGRLWQSGIEIEGNLELAKHVNSSWWNLLLSYRLGQNMSSSPGGLANDCYHGHSFWDVEQFMWPNLLMFHPKLAAGSLQYRFDRREAAAANAKVWKTHGMKFPWESAVSGEEVCPWGNGLKEIHINGDISLAFWQYWQATGDKSWLQTIGWPVLDGIAEFWASKTRTLSNGSAFRIDGVVDVDEKAVNVADSGYTNAVAKVALSNAIKAAHLVEKPYKIGPNWQDMATQLPIPISEAVGGVPTHHAEYAGAKGGSGLGVIMMQYPLDIPSRWPEGWTEDVQRNDLHFYASQNPGGNAMYWWAFAVAWLGLGEPDLAAKYLARSTVHNVYGPFHIWSERPHGGGCPNFVTGAGAYLQVFWAGYGGIRLTDAALEFHDPRLPPDSTGLRLRGLSYRGSLINAWISTGNETTITLQLHEASSRSAPLLVAKHSGTSYSKVMRPETLVCFPSAGITTIQLWHADPAQ